MYRNQFRPLTNDEIIRLAPAAGATQPYKEVSDKYSFVPTIEVVDLLRSSGWTPIQAEQSSVRKDEREGFQKHRIRFQMSGLEISSGERVDLVLHNSHDRGSAFKLLASIWRYICGNGAMTSSDLFNFSHRHINFSETDFIQSANKIAEGASQIGAQVNELKTIELMPDERGVFAESAHQLIYPVAEDAPINPYQLLEERRYDDKGKDLWTTFNVIQENIIKGGLRGRKKDANGRIRRSRTRKVKSIDRDIKLNKALWTLTEKMAALKLAA